MYHKTRGDLESSIDNFCLAGEDLPLDFRHRLRRISADRAPRAGLRRWPYLGSGNRIKRVDRAAVPAVEFGRVIEEEVDLLALLLPHLGCRFRDRAERAG